MRLGPVLWALDSQVIKMVGLLASSWSSAHKQTRPCWLPPGTNLLLWACSFWEPALGWEEARQGVPGPPGPLWGQDLPLMTRDPGHISLTQINLPECSTAGPSGFLEKTAHSTPWYKPELWGLQQRTRRLSGLRTGDV